MMTVKIYKPQRQFSFLFTVLLLALLVANMSCKQSADSNANGNASNANSSVASDETSSTPPFPTKEPERYQATWVISGSAGPKAASIPGLSGPLNQQMPVARDGEKRRFETEMIPGIKLIYLQLPKGRYTLFPSKKIYAEIKIDGNNNPLSSTQGMPSEFTPDKLISSSPAGAKYEKLGTEQINGRMTTKYRVTVSGDGGSTSKSETIVWADESLGMPIKSETTSQDGSKFTWEMRDIKLDVDASLFELPKDYKKVEQSELLSSAVPSVNDILGIANENKTTKKR